MIFKLTEAELAAIQARIGKARQVTAEKPRRGRPPLPPGQHKPRKTARLQPDERKRVRVKRHDAPLAMALLDEGIDGWEREHVFHPTRKWRFDIAFPAIKLAVEVEGAVWTGGRHVHPTGFLKDMQKYNAAALLGWRLLRFTPEQVRQGIAVSTILQAIDVPRDPT